MKARPLAPAGERALEVLRDGQWHPALHLLGEVAKVYPPGRAMRRVQSENAAQREVTVAKAQREGREFVPGRRRDQSTDEVIVRGKRRMARQYLYNWFKLGFLEFDPAYDGRAWAEPGWRVRASERLLSGYGGR